MVKKLKKHVFCLSARSKAFGNEFKEQIRYTVRAKQNSLQLQEAYFMLCDIFKIIETRQLVNSIQNLPFELMAKLEKLHRFVRIGSLSWLIFTGRSKAAFVQNRTPSTSLTRITGSANGFYSCSRTIS